MKLRKTLYTMSLVFGCLAIAGCNNDSDTIVVPGDDDDQHQQEDTCSCKNGCNDQGECLDPCDKCKPDQTCDADGKCKDKQTDQPDACNNSCKPNQTCIGVKCVDNDKICDPACVGDRVCENNTCVFKCEVHCGDTCCEAGQLCDQVNNTCQIACFDGSASCNYGCCSDKQECLEGVGCADICDPETQHACIVPNEQGFCCANGDLCVLETASCTKDCGDLVKCGETCCQAGDICYKANPDDLSDPGACKKNCTATQTRCGVDLNLCCDNDTQVCVFNKCLPKGKACTESKNCAMDEFCDESSHTCVNAAESPNVCEYRPPVGEFSPKVKWNFNSVEVENTPAVADLTGDGIPEVVFVSMDSQILFALNGDTGAVMAQTTARKWNDYDGITLGDVDKDGKIEVMVATAELTSTSNPSGLSILNLVSEGSGWKWVEKSFVVIKEDPALVNGAGRRYADIHPTLADMDSDGVPEIVTTRGIVRGNDLSKWQCTLYFPSYGAWYQYGIVVADLDQDGKSEIIGHKMYDDKCQLLMDESEPEWGFTAVADLVPNNGKPGELVPEIVRLKPGAVSVWKVYKNGGTWTQEKVWQTQHPGGGGGYPIIADFNGDKKAEIGIAGGSEYAVFKGDNGQVLWHVPTVDPSQRTGSAVFDFEGDGKAEVVYRDECYVRIYNGEDGRELWRAKATSGTVVDYPLIVDVDGDGKTEIVTTSSHNLTSCGDFKNTPYGIVVFEDSWGNWVRTRQIWNQHSYHVTNINDDGSIPQHEEANWLKYNNYRQNVQPSGVFNAPDFKAGSLESEVVGCDDIKLTAHVSNEGAYGVRAGLPVSFYVLDPNGNTGKKARIGTAYVEDALSPSGTGRAVLHWNRKAVVDGTEITVSMPAKVFYIVDEPSSESPKGVYPECHEDNNQMSAVSVDGCPAA